MENLQWFDVLRLFTAILAGICFVISWKRLYKFWNSPDHDLNDLWWIIPLFFLVMVESNLEQIITDVEFGARNVFGFLTALASTVAFLKARRRRRSNECNTTV